MRAAVLLVPIAAVIAALGALVWLFAFDRDAATRSVAQQPEEPARPTMRVGGVLPSGGAAFAGAHVEV